MKNYVKGFAKDIYKWARLSHLFDKTKNISAVFFLANSYRRVFKECRASETDVQLVLCDLAIESNAFGITKPGPDVTQYSSGFIEGKRALFFHLLNAADLSPEALSSLRRAAREEENYIEGSEDDF